MASLGEAGNPLHVKSESPAETSGEILTLVERDDRRWWPIVVSVGSSVLSAILATVLCLTVSERNAERGRAARAELQRTQCLIVVAMDETYRNAPPSTRTGQVQAQKMRELRTALACPPHQDL